MAGSKDAIADAVLLLRSAGYIVSEPPCGDCQGRGVVPSFYPGTTYDQNGVLIGDGRTGGISWIACRRGCATQTIHQAPKSHVNSAPYQAAMTFVVADQPGITSRFIAANQP